MSGAEPSARPRRQVAVAVVRRGGRVLVQTRGGAWRGYWEFPGGGREAGETLEDAAVRECEEELGLTVRVLSVLHEVDWEHAGGALHVVFFACEAAPDGEPRPRLGQEWRWEEIGRLEALPMLPANGPVIRLLAADAS